MYPNHVYTATAEVASHPCPTARVAFIISFIVYHIHSGMSPSCLAFMVKPCYASVSRGFQSSTGWISPYIRTNLKFRNRAFPASGPKEMFSCTVLYCIVMEFLRNSSVERCLFRYLNSVLFFIPASSSLRVLFLLNSVGLGQIPRYLFMCSEVVQLVTFNLFL